MTLIHVCRVQIPHAALSKQSLQHVNITLLSPSRVSEALQQIFSGRAQIRGEQLDLERQLKENELRQRYSEEDNLQVQYFCAKEKTEKVAGAYAAIHRFHHPCRKTAAESSFHFSVLYSCLNSHLRHYRTESLLPSSWLFSAICVPALGPAVNAT